MSFEGYYQVLCENGHYSTKDCYQDDHNSFTCPICGQKMAWWNLVDVTNGSWDEDNTRIDGYVELKIKTPVELCVCPDCSVEHVKTEATYKVPRNKGHKYVLDI